MTKVLFKIFFAIVSARWVSHSFYERNDIEGDIFACLIASWFQKHFRFFVKTHMREERQLGGAAQPAGLAIHHLSQTLLIRVAVSKTTWQL